jgi:transcriptional regulator with XRE-family HTH domain
MTQKEIGQAVGVSQGYISQLLKGERRPSWDVAKDLAAITDTNIDLWMEGQEQDKRSAIKAA